MSENPEIVMQAKHIVKQFPASHGRTLTACNDINLTMYKAVPLNRRRERMRKVNFCPHGNFPGSAHQRRDSLSWQKHHRTSKKETWENRQNLQMVFQDPLASFNPKMKIGDILTESLMNYKRSKEAKETRRVQ